MRRVAGGAFVVVEEFPAVENAPKLAGRGPLAGWRLTGIGDMDDGKNQPVVSQGRGYLLKQIALQIIRNDDEIVGRDGERELRAGQVRDFRAHRQAALSGSLSEDAYSGFRAVEGCDLPAQPGQKQRISACAAGQIECASGLQSCCNIDQKARGLVFCASLSGAI